MIDKGVSGCTTETDCSKNPSDIDLIASVIATGDKASEETQAYYRQLAIEMVIKAYNLDLFLPNVNVGAYSDGLDYQSRPGNNLGYEPWYENAGETQYIPGFGTNVRIGEDAFRSPGYLASVVGHEVVHVEQYNTGNYSDKNPGKAIMEVQAFHGQLDSRSRLGLTEDEVYGIQLQLQLFMEIWLSTAPARTGH